MHALVGPNNAVVKYSTEYKTFDTSVGVKPGYRWVPVEFQIVGSATGLTKEKIEEIIEANRVIKRTTHERSAVDAQKDAVKQEARRRIITRFPDWKQTNMVARGVELQNLFRLNGAWTAQELGEAAALDAAWAWVKSVRTASDAIEQMSPIPDDYAADARWPA